MSNELLLLYLTPRRLFQDNGLLKLQWQASETIIPCFLRTLYFGDIQVRLHEFDKIVAGLKNHIDSNDSDIYTKIAMVWYYFTRVTHQSLGPRVGNFAQNIIRDWVDSAGFYNVGEYVDITLGKALRNIFRLQANYKSKIDFVAKSRDQSAVAFIELRMSEHTGGRTGQESLMDKFNKVLDLVVNNTLPRAASRKGINTIELSIGVLFNEQHELIKESNYNVGRLDSLISYIMEENHVWGRIKKLSDAGYTLCDGRSINEETIETRLKTVRRVCLGKGEFKIHIKILLGDEFFKEYMKRGFEDLIKEHASVIADDVWVMYMLAINEIKVAKLLGITNVNKIYEESKKNAVLSEFFSKFSQMYNSGKYVDIKSYTKDLNRLISEYASKILEVYSAKREGLKLLETNDITQNYLYLKYVCGGVLAIYLTRDVKRDTEFSQCRWEEAPKSSRKKTKSRSLLHFI